MANDRSESAPHLLVVIDHLEARVYRTEVHGAVPERIAPYDPHGHGRHLHSAHEWTDGKRPPERKSYYEAVAKTLLGLKDHHSDVAGKIVGSVVVDAHHTTEAQLLAKAREFYAEFNRK